MIKKILLGATASAAALGGVALGGQVAHAAPSTVTAVTHVLNRADSGNGGTWATDAFTRTLTVSVAASQVNAPRGDTLYTATVKDSGGFIAKPGALTPNQSVAGLRIAHAVKGALNGGITYTIAAPTADGLTGAVPAFENDMGGVKVSTANWPVQAFGSSSGVRVSENAGWGWTYSTGCETWRDASNNADGNLAADGNITGKLCFPPKPVRPYVYNGHVVTPAGSRATVGWSESLHGWPVRADGRKCVVVQEFGPGFTDALGGPHTGFTCDTTGYLTGMSVGHGYSLYVWPAAAGDAYAGSHAIVPGVDKGAHVYLVATAS